jgi:predicted RNA binding protein YcfA (HicA-like mRNA interferase family)
MKKNQLLKILKQYGCKFVRHGSEHDKYIQPKTGKVDYVPRHSDITEPTAWKIIKNLSC